MRVESGPSNISQVNAKQNNINCHACVTTHHSAAVHSESIYNINIIYKYIWSMYSWQCLVICQPICMLAHDFCYTFPSPGLSCSCVAARTFSTSLVLAEWLHLSRTENKQTPPAPLGHQVCLCLSIMLSPCHKQRQQQQHPIHSPSFPNEPLPVRFVLHLLLPLYQQKQL